MSAYKKQFHEKYEKYHTMETAELDRCVAEACGYKEASESGTPIWVNNRGILVSTYVDFSPSLEEGVVETHLFHILQNLGIDIEVSYPSSYSNIVHTSSITIRNSLTQYAFMEFGCDNGPRMKTIACLVALEVHDYFTSARENRLTK